MNYRRKYNIFLILLLLLLTLKFKILASSNVFLATFPYKANIYINNTYMGKSPLVLVNLNSGKYSIRIEKQGYQTFSGKFELADNKTYNLTFSLIPATFSFLVNNNFSIEWDGKNIESPFIVEGMSPGTYRISIKKQSIKIEQENIYSDLKWITLISSIVSYGLYAYFEIFPGQNLYVNGIYDALKYTFLTTGVISTCISIYSFVVDSKKQKYSYTINPNPVLNEDQILFYNGLNLLNKGDLKKSLEIFKNILNYFKNSRYYPSVLYYVGYIYERKNNFKFALKYYEKLIYEYPVYEWYDITLFEAAMIYYKNGSYKKSLYLLNNILFIDKLIVSEDLVARLKFLNYYFIIKKGEKNKENRDNLNFYYNDFKTKYSNSKYKYEVFYYYAKFLIDNLKKEEARTILKELISINNEYQTKAVKLYNETYK